MIFHEKPFAVLTIAAALFAGCAGDEKTAEEPEGSEGPMEEAGEELDEAAEDVEEGTEDAVDETGDAIGNAGDEIDEETEDVE